MEVFMKIMQFLFTGIILIATGSKAMEKDLSQAGSKRQLEQISSSNNKKQKREIGLFYDKAPVGILPVELHEELVKFITNNGHDIAINFWLYKHGQNNKPFLTLEGHAEPINCIEYDKTTDRLFSGSIDKTIKMWDLKTGKCEKTFAGHTEEVNALIVYDNYLISGAAEIKIWDIETGSCIKTINTDDYVVTTLYLHKESKQLFSGLGDASIKVWNIDSGECLKTYVGHDDAILCFTYNPATNQIISGADSGEIIIWNHDGSCAKKILSTGGDSSVTGLCMDTEHNKLIASFTTGLIKIYDVIDWSVESFGEPPLIGNYYCTYNPINKKIYYFSYDNSLKILGTSEIKKVHRIPFESVTSLYFDPKTAFAVYGIENVIYAKHLIDPQLKKLIMENVDIARLLMEAYEHYENHQTLDLQNNQRLYDAFLKLPSELQSILSLHLHKINLPMQYYRIMSEALYELLNLRSTNGE